MCLLIEEVNRKNNEDKHGGNAFYVKGRSANKEKLQEKARSKSKSCRNVKNMECYNYGKKGHLTKDCQSEKKGKDKK